VRTGRGVVRFGPVFRLYLVCGSGFRAWDSGSGIREQLLHRNVQRFRGGLVIKAHRLCASLNSRLESNKEEENVRVKIKKRRSGHGTRRRALRACLQVVPVKGSRLGFKAIRRSPHRTVEYEGFVPPKFGG